MKGGLRNRRKAQGQKKLSWRKRHQRNVKLRSRRKLNDQKGRVMKARARASV